MNKIKNKVIAILLCTVIAAITSFGLYYILFLFGDNFKFEDGGRSVKKTVAVLTFSLLFQFSIYLIFIESKTQHTRLRHEQFYGAYIFYFLVVFFIPFTLLTFYLDLSKQVAWKLSIIGIVGHVVIGMASKKWSPRRRLY